MGPLVGLLDFDNQLAPRPTGFTATSIDSESAVLKWNAVEGAGSYLIEYRWVGSDQWMYGEETAEITYTLRALESGKRYLVKVRVKGDGVRYTSVAFRPGADPRPLRVMPE